jgi:hypothetical protein
MQVEVVTQSRCAIPAHRQWLIIDEIDRWWLGPMGLLDRACGSAAV